jgi:hypothetical protein
LALVLAALPASTDPGQIQPLAQAVSVVAQKLPADQAGQALALVLAALPASTDPDQTAALAETVKTLRNKLGEEGAIHGLLE